MRIRIWVVTTSSFDSGWTPIAADGALKNIPHNVGENTDDYIVDLQFKDRK